MTADAPATAQRDAARQEPATDAELGPFDALGHRFLIACNDDVLSRHVGHLYAPLAAGAAVPTGRYRITVAHDADLPYAVEWEDGQLCRSATLGRALSMLQWHINQRAVAAADVPVLHAAAAVHNGAAVVFPAPMEGGKTTLVAGLVRSGFRYLTDEAAAVDPTTLAVTPYPKPLSVDAGSWDVLADLRPDVAAPLETAQQYQWQVAPHDIRPDAVAAATPLAAIVATRYDPIAPTSLQPVSRADTLVTLARSTFEWGAEDARSTFHALGEVVRRCRCFRLVVNDLDEACRLVTAMMEDL